MFGMPTPDDFFFDPTIVASYLQHYTANYAIRLRVRILIDRIIRTTHEHYAGTESTERASKAHGALMYLLDNPERLQIDVMEDGTVQRRSAALTPLSMFQGLDQNDMMINEQIHKVTGIQLPATFKYLFNMSPLFSWNLHLYTQAKRK